MRYHWSTPLFLALLVSAPALGLTPRLVKDINPNSMPASSAPRSYVPVGGLTYFSAHGAETGRELWRTDGTAAGTFPVVDACPGDCSANPGGVALAGSSYFFRVPEPDFRSPFLTASELWVTGGVPANTFLLTSALLLPKLGRWNRWFPAQRVLYFFADDGIHGMELWRSNGTAAGTFLVADIRPGPNSSEPADLTDLNGQPFFRANDGIHGPALWASDGTERGTRLVLDPVPGLAGHEGPQLLRVAGGKLFFAAPVPQQGLQLWSSDGTAGGTSPLTSFQSPDYPAILDATVLGSKVLFVAVNHPANGQELWTSDGTVLGTRALTNVARWDAFFGGFDLQLPITPFGSRMVFAMHDGVHGIEPWITDGTPEGTNLLRDVCPGECLGIASPFFETAVAGNLLLFSGRDDGNGAEPWATDGTTAGTRMIRDLCSGSCSSSPFRLQEAPGGKVYFITSERRLWLTDGTVQGTVALTGFESSPALSSNLAGTVHDGVFLFTADDGQHGLELWRSDGTPVGTRFLADLNTSDAGGSAPSSLRAAGGRVYFFADDGQHGSELWVSDGTAAGTALVYEFVPGAESTVRQSFIAEYAQKNGVLYFVPSSGNARSNRTLWRTNGTSKGTYRLTSAGLQIDGAVGLRAVGNQVFFAGLDNQHGGELWVTNGSPRGTRLVADLAAGESSSFPDSPTSLRGHLYFTAGVGETGRELWRSDGTRAGTVLVKDIHRGPGIGSWPSLLTEHLGRLYFFAEDGEHGRELWRTDGTAAGTSLAAELVPGPSGFSPSSLISAGRRLFLSGSSGSDSGLWVSDGTAGGTTRISSTQVDGKRAILFKGSLYFRSSTDNTLWRSDGTKAGTIQLRDRDGRVVLGPAYFRIFAGRLLFTTSDQGWLFQSDGTPEGTFRILDLSGPSEPASFELVPAGQRLLFRKWDPATGSELWALE